MCVRERGGRKGNVEEVIKREKVGRGEEGDREGEGEKEGVRERKTNGEVSS